MNEDKAARFHRLSRRTAWVALLLNVCLMMLLLPGGASIVLRDAAVSISSASSSSPLTVAIFTALLALLIEAAVSAPGFYRTFVLERRYGLSSISLRTWSIDHLKGLAIGVALAVGAAEIMYFTLGRWPRWWWAASAGVFIVALLIVARIAPVLLLPIFYRFKPLDREGLRARLETLSARAGIPVLGVYEWGLGEKTRRANAVLVGTGRSRRVLLSDTLLASYTDDEIEVILAHELGHHAHGDIRNGLLIESLLILASCASASAALHALWPWLGLHGPADVAGLPLVVLVSGAVSLLTRPGVNALSRRNEHRADRFALRLTERPDAFESAMRRLAAHNLAEERPSAATLWFFHTHPPFEQRIRAARAFLS
ncbi:MAG TPA: M48 family metalloprotease [Vicinamibacterales bacterium]